MIKKGFGDILFRVAKLEKKTNSAKKILPYRRKSVFLNPGKHCRSHSFCGLRQL